MLYSPDHYEPTPQDWQDYLATLDSDEESTIPWDLADPDREFDDAADEDIPF